jgi:hypothetical protein
MTPIEALRRLVEFTWVCTSIRSSSAAQLVPALPGMSGSRNVPWFVPPLIDTLDTFWALGVSAVTFQGESILQLYVITLPTCPASTHNQTSHTHNPAIFGRDLMSPRPKANVCPT